MNNKAERLKMVLGWILLLKNNGLVGIPWNKHELVKVVYTINLAKGGSATETLAKKKV